MDGLVHEQQSLLFCGLHAINNLIQPENENMFFRKIELDSICEELLELEYDGRPPFATRLVNPHRSILGIGNYDANVILCALQRRGFETEYFNPTKNVDTIPLASLHGILLNTQHTSLLVYTSRHWYALLRHVSGWVNLDSKLATPNWFENDAAVREHLRGVLSGRGTLMLVKANPQHTGGSEAS
eukprot:c7125_g1_i1.p1 GENE.c7125_g1_i1~~c7125_g1_i1.p1  ORF type:complete len:185 (-),score=33.80 c7125_g1_i1:7-561(-)